MLAALLQNNQQRHAGAIAPSTTCLVLAGITQGVAMTPQTMIGSGGAGGPYTFSASGLPTGLILASNGVMSGTPTVHGIFNYVVTVLDHLGTMGTVNCSVTVQPSVVPTPAKALTAHISIRPRLEAFVSVEESLGCHSISFLIMTTS